MDSTASRWTHRITPYHPLLAVPAVLYWASSMEVHRCTTLVRMQLAGLTWERMGPVWPLLTLAVSPYAHEAGSRSPPFPLPDAWVLPPFGVATAFLVGEGALPALPTGAISVVSPRASSLALLARPVAEPHLHPQQAQYFKPDCFQQLTLQDHPHQALFDRDLLRPSFSSSFSFSSQVLVLENLKHRRPPRVQRSHSQCCHQAEPLASLRHRRHLDLCLLLIHQKIPELVTRRYLFCWLNLQHRDHPNPFDHRHRHPVVDFRLRSKKLHQVCDLYYRQEPLLIVIHWTLHWYWIASSRAADFDPVLINHQKAPCSYLPTQSRYSHRIHHCRPRYFDPQFAGCAHLLVHAFTDHRLSIDRLMNQAALRFNRAQQSPLDHRDHRDRQD